MKKIVIHYPYIPHYRLPIFTLLSQSDNFEFEFWADESSGDKFLFTDNSGLNMQKAKLIHLKIPFINHKIEWQPKIIKLMLLEPMDLYIVMGGVYSLTTWICAIIAKFRGIPVLMWTHGYLKNDIGLKNWIRKLFFSLDTGFLLYGNIAKNIMIKKGFDPKHLHVIYNSLDYEIQKAYREQLNYQDRLSTRKQLGIDENSILLISIGRVMTKLKLDLAIKAVKYQIDNGKSTALLIVGDGPQKAELESLVKSLDLSEYVIFYGACHAEEELSYLYNASDYSVVMGKVGLAAMHSLAYGIPMITNDNMDEHFPEIEAIIEGKTGWYFHENDIADFCSKLNMLPYRSTYYEKSIQVIELNFTPTVQNKLIHNALLTYCKDNKND